VALGFATSAEREAIVITTDYQNFLGRAPEPGAVAGWENALQQGLDQAGLEADIVGSAEFFARSGGTNEDFVTAAYQAILGRTPGQAEIQPWVDMLPQPSADQLITLHLKPIDLNLLGLEVQTNDITVTVSARSGSGELLGNVLTLASNLIDLQKASDALNQVLGTTVDLLNSGALGINLGSGSFDTRPEATTDVLTLHVAPVHLDLLGALVDTSPVDVSITAHSGPGLILGNIVTDLANLFNDLPGQPLNIDTLNQKLGDLLGLVNNAVGGIPSATVPTVQPHEGQVLNLTVPALDLNLLGLKLDTTPITVNADAVTGSGNLLGNVLTSLLNTLDATPDKVAQLNNTLNGVLARVVGVLNASSLVVSPALVSALPLALQTLIGGPLVAPTTTEPTPILDLIIASQDGTSPPVDVNLLGLKVTTSDIDAHLKAVTGDGLILGNLLYNVANLANPGGSADLLALLNALGAGDLNSTAGSGGGSLSQEPAPPLEQLLQIELQPIDLNLLGLEVKADGSLPDDTTPDPILVTLSAQGGDAKLLGNLLGAISTLVNLPAVESALNNALGTVVDLVNSVQLSLPPGTVGTGPFDTGTPSDTPVLDAFVAPVHVDLLGLLVDTSPIHVTITAHAGDGLVLGNVVADLAHLFDDTTGPLNVDTINTLLGNLLNDLNAQIPGITPAPIPPVSLGPDQFLELTVPPLDLNLLGLLVKTSPITVNAFDQTGNGNLLGNFLSSLLTTIDATPGNLTVLNQNLDALLAKVVGVLNAADLTLSQDAISALPAVVQTLLSPVLISPTPGATAPVLDLRIASPAGTTPVRADLLGLVVTTSDVRARLLAQTGDGQVLGNLLYNAAHLLDSGNALSLLFLLTELAGL
jgi:predicted nucleotidyltransferase